MNIFLPISLNICFRCPKEPSHWDRSFEYPQHMFWLRNEKNNFLVRTLIWRPGKDYFLKSLQRTTKSIKKYLACKKFFLLFISVPQELRSQVSAYQDTTVPWDRNRCRVQSRRTKMSMEPNGRWKTVKIARRAISVIRQVSVLTLTPHPPVGVIKTWRFVRTLYA